MQIPQVLALVGFTLATTTGCATVRPSHYQMGDLAPSLGQVELLQAGDRTNLDLDSLKDEVVVLEFWATWCRPCIGAIDHLNKLKNKLAGEPIRFVSITDEPPGEVVPFLKKKPIQGWIGLSKNELDRDALGLPGLPSTVVIDREGRVAGVTYPLFLEEQHLRGLLAGEKVSLRSIPAKGFEAILGPGALVQSREEETPPRLLVVVRESRPGEEGRSRAGPGLMEQYAVSLPLLLTQAFGFSTGRLRVVGELPKGKFDLVVRAQKKSSYQAVAELQRQALIQAFGLRIKRMTSEEDALVLAVEERGPANLPPTTTPQGGMSMCGALQMKAKNSPIASLVNCLESHLGLPVVDETELPDRYDYELVLGGKEGESLGAEDADVALRSQLGISLTPARRNVELLLVEVQASDIAR